MMSESMSQLHPPLPWERWVRVLLVDTNVLRSDVLRRVRVRPGPFGRMLSAVSLGGVRIIAPRHVVDEMDEKIRGFAEKASLDPDAAEDVWRNEYRPLLTVVDAGDMVDALAAHPHVAATLVHDRDDAPLAVLAVLLGQVALSEDPDLGLLGTGRPWLAHIVAATDAALSDEMTWVYGWGGAEAVSGLAHAGRSAYGGLQRTVGSRGAAILAIILAGLVVAVLVTPRTREWLVSTPPVRAAGRVARAAGQATVTVLVNGTAGDAFLRDVALVDDTHIPPLGSLVRHLSRCRQPQTVDEIAAELGWESVVVERVLDAHAAFVPTDDGGWQLGRHLAPPPPVVAHARLAPPRSVPNLQGGFPFRPAPG
jgi:predicted nucleic acid-binding protein